MKNTIISATLGLVAGLMSFNFLFDRGGSAEPDSHPAPVMVFKTPTMDADGSFEAEETSMTAVRNFVQAYHRPVASGGGGAPLITNMDSLQCAGYHVTPDPASSEPIKSFYLSKEMVIDVLTEKFAKEKPEDDFRGFAGIFGYDSDEGAYNITWSLVYSEKNQNVQENSCGEMRYFLPEVTNESDGTYLYEHIYLCPPHCRANEDRFE